MASLPPLFCIYIQKPCSVLNMDIVMAAFRWKSQGTWERWRFAFHSGPVVPSFGKCLVSTASGVLLVFNRQRSECCLTTYNGHDNHSQQIIIWPQVSNAKAKKHQSILCTPMFNVLRLS